MDLIIVQEKLDGSCVCVAKTNGELVPLIRAGYRATESIYEQHHLFHGWVMNNKHKFELFDNGERIVGEWLAQAHGTRYNLLGTDIFVVFDIMREHIRADTVEVNARCAMNELQVIKTIHAGEPIDTDEAMAHLGGGSFQAGDDPEGVVYRCERKGVISNEVDFLGKWVAPWKEPGKYLESVTGGKPVWNWRP